MSLRRFCMTSNDKSFEITIYNKESRLGSFIMKEFDIIDNYYLDAAILGWEITEFMTINVYI